MEGTAITAREESLSRRCVQARRGVRPSPGGASSAPDDVIAGLKALANPANAAGMARYGIRGQGVLGICIPVLRKMAVPLRGDHELAQALWDSHIHEARLLAGFIDDPTRVNAAQMERWVRGFDSWDVCDLVCSNLFDRTPCAYAKADAWTRRKAEFVKRAGFSLMAALAVHDKAANDVVFARLLQRIEAEASDGRNFVRKAVNWALRQIGKRNRGLHAKALCVARRLAKSQDVSARWVGKDALRELESAAVKERLRSRVRRRATKASASA